MMKFKYLRHPLRSAHAAKSLIRARLEMRKFAAQGDEQFGNDPHYDPRAVAVGFACRLDKQSDDKLLLERICAAYIRSVQQQQLASPTYVATPWWEEIRQRSLGPVKEALLNRNITALQGMYGNFFRDPCSTGLVSVPYGMTDAYFRANIKEVHRRYYLADVLRRVAYWKQQTAGRFPLSALAAAEIGNPFGVMIEKTLIEAGAPFRHYCAQRIGSLLSSATNTVAELGGGFGGMAYYLLRDRPATRYLGFDVPESVALTSYYLIKAFPRLKFLLYGEADATPQAIMQADVTLLPLFELEKLPTGSVDLTFSSHSICDVVPTLLSDYLDNIARITRKQFLCIGVDGGEGSAARLIGRHLSFRVSKRRLSGWHAHKVRAATEVECLYSLACDRSNG